MGKRDGSLFPFFGKRDTFKEKGKKRQFSFSFFRKRETFNKIAF
jgi:hypothetical protein